MHIYVASQLGSILFVFQLSSRRLALPDTYPASFPGLEPHTLHCLRHYQIINHRRENVSKPTTN